MLRFLPLLALASCGIFGLSEKEEQDLARYQRNASTYYDGGRYDQALDQVRRGLEIVPTDYKLNYIRGWCLLRKSQDDPALLAAAADQFDYVLTLRSEADQGPQAHLGCGIVRSKMGWERLRRAEQIREEAARLRLEGDDLEQRLVAATELEKQSSKDFDVAEHQLSLLLDKGENLLEAHYHLMHTKVWRGDYEAAVYHGNVYLEQVAALQDGIRETLGDTLYADHERDLRIRLQNRIDQEIEVRGFLANLHYKHGHHELVVEQLDAVLLKKPQLYYEYFNRGRSLLALGRMNEAREDFRHFLATTQLPRENPQVAEALRLLREQ